MKTLEEQIALIADEAERQLATPDAAVGSMAPGEQRGPHRLLAFAAAGVLAASLGVGLWVLAQRESSDLGVAEQAVTATTVVIDPELSSIDDPLPNDGTSPEAVVPDPSTTVGPSVVPEPTTTVIVPPPSEALSPLPENEPTVVADPSQLWFVPAVLPPGFEFEVATDSGFFGAEDSRPERSIEFRSDVDGGEIRVSTDGFWIGLDDAPGAEPIEIGGAEWTIRRIEPGGEMMQITLERVTPDSSFSIRSTGVAESAVIEAAASLTEVPATELARPPLSVPFTGGVVVAETTQNGVPVSLSVATDGRYFSMVSNGGGGSPDVLEGAVTVTGAASSSPDLVADGAEAESVIEGLLHPDVATVEVELTDGRVISGAPQDQYGFEENFFLIAFPTRTEMGLELLAAVVVRDADGNVLARDTTFAE